MAASMNNNLSVVVDDEKRRLENQLINQDAGSSSFSSPPQYQPPVPAPHQGFSFNATSQQLVPITEQHCVVTSNRNPFSAYVNEPPEAAVSRPLAVIALFCWCQIWFSIPAAVMAFKRNKPRSNYNKSIALSVTAIVLGICVSFFIILYAAAVGMGGRMRWGH